MRLNVKTVDKDNIKYYYSYDFEGDLDIYLSSGLYDKTNRLIYENDDVRYKGNFYKVTLGEFFTEDGFSNVGWYLEPYKNNLHDVPINRDTLDKIKVIELEEVKY